MSGRAKAPLPGTAVRGSKTGRPIMALFDLLGRRTALRVLWELSRASSPPTFRALQTAAGTNPSVLAARLEELREAAIVDLGPNGGYVLTPSGKTLVKALEPAARWAVRWSHRLESETTRKR